MLIKILMILMLNYFGSPLNEYKQNHFTIIGTTNILKELLNKFEHVVVFYHLPTCFHCTEFEKNFQKLAKQFRKTHPLVPFVDFNCGSFTYKCRNVLKINQYPTIRVYYGLDLHINYRMERTFEKVRDWLVERIDKLIYIINKENQYLMETLLDGGDGIMIYNGNQKSKNFKFYYDTSKIYDMIYYFITEEEEILKKYELNDKDSIYFLKRERYMIKEKYTGVEKSHYLIEFMDSNTIDTFKNYDADLFESNKSEPKTFMILFCKENEDDLIMDFHYFAKSNKDKFYFITIDLNKENNYEVDKLIYDLGIDKTNMPTVRAINYKNLNLSTKYKLNEEINLKNLKKFSKDINNISLSYIKNDEHIKNKKLGEIIEPISSNEIDKKILKNYDSDFILLIHDNFDNCKKSKIMNDQILNLIVEYPKIKFYKLNLHFNEIKDWSIDVTPSLFYFKKFDIKRKNVKRFEHSVYEISDIKEFIENNNIQYKTDL